MTSYGVHVHLTSSSSQPHSVRRSVSRVKEEDEEKKNPQPPVLKGGAGGIEAVDALGLLYTHLLYGAHSLAHTPEVLVTVSRKHTTTEDEEGLGLGSRITSSSSVTTDSHSTTTPTPSSSFLHTTGGGGAPPSSVVTTTTTISAEAESYLPLYYLAALLSGVMRREDIPLDLLPAAPANSNNTNKEEEEEENPSSRWQPYPLFQCSFGEVELSLPLLLPSPSLIHHSPAPNAVSPPPYFDIIVAVDEESFDSVQLYYRQHHPSRTNQRPPVLLLYVMATEPLVWCDAVEQRLEQLLLLPPVREGGRNSVRLNTKWRDELETSGCGNLFSGSEGVRLALV